MLTPMAGVLKLVYEDNTEDVRTTITKLLRHAEQKRVYISKCYCFYRA